MAHACRMAFQAAEAHSYLIKALELIESLGEERRELAVEHISGTTQWYESIKHPRALSRD